MGFISGPSKEQLVGVGELGSVRIVHQLCPFLDGINRQDFVDQRKLPSPMNPWRSDLQVAVYVKGHSLGLGWDPTGVDFGFNPVHVPMILIGQSSLCISAK